MRKDILKFMLKATAFAATILLPLMVVYIWLDPMKALRYNDDYFSQKQPYGARLGVNKGIVSVRNFEHLRNKHNYNAFIFGSSISCYYQTKSWQRHLPADAMPYHFDSSMETPQSMAMKFEYLNQHNANIRYALIVLDPLILEVEPIDEIAHIDPPEFKGALSAPHFHYKFFSSWINLDFFRTWFPYALTGKGRVYGKSTIFEPQPIVYTAYNNEESIPEWDKIIAANPQKFAVDHHIPPYPANETEQSQQVIGEKEEAFRRIAQTLNNMHADYHVVVSPNRRRVTLNHADSQLLASIFGKSRFHDLTHQMSSIMAVDSNYYDRTHYRPCVADSILDYIYR